VKIGTGTIVDATIINAPSSTKNQKKERDPEMHSTWKGNQWYFGMKAHIGVDSTSKIVHTMETTAAKVHDSKMFAQLLHGNETRVWVMPLTPATRRRCERRLPVHRTSRASEDIGIARSPKPRWQQTTTSHRLDRGLSTSLGSSKGCSAFAKSGIEGSRRTPTAFTFASDSLTCSFKRSECYGSRRFSMPKRDGMTAKAIESHQTIVSQELVYELGCRNR